MKLTIYQYTDKFGNVFDLSSFLDYGHSSEEIAARARKYQRREDLLAALNAMRNAGEQAELEQVLGCYGYAIRCNQKHL